jgi:hypothetical protein
MHMKTILLILTLLIASITHAATDWREAIGEYDDGDGRRASLRADGNSGFILYASGSGWGDDKAIVSGTRLRCKGVRCTSKSLYDNVMTLNITFTGNGELVLDFYCKYKSEWTVFLKRLNSNSHPKSTDWSFKEYADSSQVRYIASQTDGNSGATIVAACDAKSEKINWGIRLTEKSHLGVLGAVLSLKATLKVDGKVDSGTTQSSSWSVADNRYIVPAQGTPFNIADLKKGTQVSMTLVAVKPDSTELKLETMSFSLKGSTAALNKLQESCSPNANSDLPIPLP